ncbi:hypothetical protein AB4Y89_18160 [Terriglobus sp. 2YAB30_2]|uniref:hypothetical protein n=1 Tax=unclassified Terriglobus TaxID=2628988 RepID=UPI003F972959
MRKNIFIDEIQWKNINCQQFTEGQSERAHVGASVTLECDNMLTAICLGSLTVALPHHLSLPKDEMSLSAPLTAIGMTRKR